MPTAVLSIQYATASDGVRIAYVSVGEGAPLVFATNIFGDATRYLSENAHVRGGDLGLDHFALGAVDIGAARAIAYVVEHPAVVSRLALVRPWASGERERGFRIQGP